jgi:hypothetical protein
MKQLTRDHHIYFLDPAATPAIAIDSGEELMVEPGTPSRGCATLGWRTSGS